MIEPLHGVTRDTAGPGRPADAPRSAPADTPRTSSYVAGPLPSRPATPPAGPDLRDHRYAALAAWSASAETITMAAVEVGPGSAYPGRSVPNPEAGARRRAAPPAVAAPGRPSRRPGIIVPALLAVLAVLAILTVLVLLVVVRRP